MVLIIGKWCFSLHRRSEDDDFLVCIETNPGQSSSRILRTNKDNTMCIEQDPHNSEFGDLRQATFLMN